MKNDPLIIAGRAFRSRLMVGTGKFPAAAALKAALDASEAEIVTVALRRVDLGPRESDSILSVLDPRKYVVDEARQKLILARAEREVIERHFARWRDERRKQIERRED